MSEQSSQHLHSLSNTVSVLVRHFRPPVHVKLRAHAGHAILHMNGSPEAVLQCYRDENHISGAIQRLAEGMPTI